MHIAICDDDSRLAAEPNGVVITSGGRPEADDGPCAVKTPPSCCWTNPPAALDPVSEYEVYRRFSHISGGRTSV